MNKYWATIGLTLALLFVGSWIAIFPADAAEDPWVGDITINSDGSVSPSDAPIKVSGKNYKLTSDVNGGIEIQMSDMILNGNGYRLVGNEMGSGVLADGGDDGLSDITIRNMDISYFDYGIFLNEVDDSKIMNNEIHAIDQYYDTTLGGKGIVLNNGCDRNKIIENYLHDCIRGISIMGWENEDWNHNNSIKSNFLETIYYGIDNRGSNNDIIENDMDDIWAVCIWNIGAWSCKIIDNELLMDENSMFGTGIWTIDYYVYKYNPFRIEYLAYSDDIDIVNNIIYDAQRYGISGWSDDSSIKGNQIYNVGIWPIDYYGDNLKIIDNYIGGDPGYGNGIYVGGYNCRIIGNVIDNDNTQGIFALELYDSVVKGNVLYGNSDEYSWGLELYYSDDNIFCENVIKDYGYAFWMEASYDNVFHHNDIIDNTYAFDTYAYEEPTTSEIYNTWDDGDGEGNYWSDYEGEDTDYDGIGDTDLPHNGVDYYPLMDPYN